MVKPTDLVEQLVEQHPEIISFLLEREIVCIKCGEAFWGSLGDLIANKGKDVDAVLEELNDYLTSNEGGSQ